MSEKFKYAPGKPGFGSKGDRGLDGDQGLSMYFTDFDPITQSILINSRIQNNQALWSTNPPVSLPNGRVYVTGDLFFDSDGKAYEINAEENTFTYKFASLNMGGFFVPIGTYTDKGYARYFNSNTGSKYIIDNVYTQSGAVDYTQAPSYIYNIVPANFTRIEYTNIKPVSTYNPFTTYTIGGTDNQALAIVFDEASSTFRIGNLNNDGNVRNTNLTFDVSVLKVNKQEGINTFNPNTPEGTILTNYEIAANSLFDPNFNSNPESFEMIIGSTDCSITWDLSDFTNDTDVKADLYFYEQVISYDACIFRIDASIVRPLVFHNINNSSSIKINGLKPGKPYGAHIKFSKNGWTRTSDVQTILGGLLSVYPAAGRSYTSSIINDASFYVTSTVPWSVSFVSNPSSFMTNLTCVSIGSGINPNDGSIFVDLTANPGTGRTGIIKVTPFIGASREVSIYQAGDTVTVTAAIAYGSGTSGSGYNYRDYLKDDSVNLISLPVSSVVDVTMNFYINNENNSDSPFNWYNRIVIKDKNGTTLTTAGPYTGTIPSGGGVYTTTYYIHVTGISQSQLPLNIEPYAKVESNYAFTGRISALSRAENINFYRNSGPTISITNLSSGTSSTATVSWFNTP